MTTVSHINLKGAQPIRHLQQKNAALVVSAHYPNKNSVRPAACCEYLYYIYSGIPINKDATSNAPKGSEPEGIDHRIGSANTAPSRWCAEKGGHASGVFRQATSSAIVRNRARQSIFAAQYASESTIEQQIRHNMNCCGGSIFARYD